MATSPTPSFFLFFFFSFFLSVLSFLCFFLSLFFFIQADPVLVNAPNGINFYGESQGALLARAFVTVTNSPKVHNLVALNGPQNGVGECPYIDLGPLTHICGDAGSALDVYHWPFCSFCTYWRGKDKASYLKVRLAMYSSNNVRCSEICTLPKAILHCLC